jgi:hypothetical protein
VHHRSELFEQGAHTMPHDIADEQAGGFFRRLRVDPGEVSIGDPIDLSKRLCGAPQIRFPYAC